MEAAEKKLKKATELLELVLSQNDEKDELQMEILKFLEKSVNETQVNTIPEFISDMNWNLLQEQKLTLLTIINWGQLKLLQPQLNGIIHLIDNVQDYAVLGLNLDKNLVFPQTNNEPLLHDKPFHLKPKEILSPCPEAKPESNTNKIKFVLLCNNCNSNNIRYHPNNAGSPKHYCEDCQGYHTMYMSSALQSDAEIIGFQVVGKDGTNYAGHLHPHIDYNWCVNLSQARKMIEADTNAWRLDAIWSGDIENVQLKFTGDPRK